jgi:osmotically-inducible protein OsmY
MADYNRDRGRYASDDNWNQDRDRDYGLNDNNRDYDNYNNVNDRSTDWRNMSRDRESGTQSSYGSTSYGNTATDYNNTGAYGGGGYGMYPDDYNNRTAAGGYADYGNANRSNTGWRYGRREDWGRANADTGMNYHNDRRRNWGDNNMNYGGSDYENRFNSGRGYAGDYNSGYYGPYAGMGYDRGYDSRYNRDYMGYGNRDHDNDWQRTSGQWNRYGGDTRNYGNMNQGGYDRNWWDRTRDEVASWFGDDDAERRRRRDQMNTSGGYRGKGPRDYNRSEDRIREDVCDRLTDDDMLDATNVQVQVQGNEVILSGTVNSRDQKRRAEDLVESISGVRDVENRIHVAHNYTGTRDVGKETGTTNEVIRNERKGKNT